MDRSEVPVGYKCLSYLSEEVTASFTDSCGGFSCQPAWLLGSSSESRVG